jgi:hypothetical protein
MAAASPRAGKTAFLRMLLGLTRSPELSARLPPFVTSAKSADSALP